MDFNENINENVSENANENINVYGDSEDLFEEYSEFSGEYSEEYDETAETPKSNFVIQKPIMVAITVFVLTALVIFSTIFTYNLIKGEQKHPIIGAWVFADDPDSGEYVIFEENGEVYYSLGSFKYYGTYSVKTVEIEKTETQAAYTYEALESDFAIFAQSSGDVKIVFDEDYEKMTLEFTMNSLEFIKVEMPELNLEPDKVTHASADEVGLTGFTADKDVIGTWKTEMLQSPGLYEYYTFNEDGTCVYKTDFIDYAGYGNIIEFKYTIKNGRVFLTQKLYDGTTDDADFSYRMDRGKFIIDAGNGYEYACERVK